MTKYPTSARAWPESKDLIEVGVFRCNDDWSNRTSTIPNAEALARWKGETT